MSKAIITVENLGKRYIIGHQRPKGDGMRHVIEAAMRAPFARLRSRSERKEQKTEKFWAMKDVSIEVQQGEIVGILGRNGAGKSTLLKVLSRITDPTIGRIHYSDVIDLDSAPGRPAKYRPQLKKLELFDGNDQPLRGKLPAGGSVKALIYFELENPCPNVDAELGFYTLGGERICTAHSAYEPCRKHKRRTGDQLFVCEIPNLPLLPGDYTINVSLEVALREVDRVEDVTRLTVIQSDFYGTGILPTKGVFLLNNRWTLDRDREEVAA